MELLGGICLSMGKTIQINRCWEMKKALNRVRFEGFAVLRYKMFPAYDKCLYIKHIPKSKF